MIYYKPGVGGFVALGAFVNDPAIFSISTTPFFIAPASTDPLLDKSRCLWIDKRFKIWLSLNYSGPRSPITTKNLKSVADMPELTKQKISKEIAMGKLKSLCSFLEWPNDVWCLAASITLIRRKLWRTHVKRLQCDGTARTFFRVMSLSLNLFILSDKHYYCGL
jgi:hypothetical protein